MEKRKIDTSCLAWRIVQKEDILHSSENFWKKKNFGGHIPTYMLQVTDR
jgi:hypothetical protein